MLLRTCGMCLRASHHSLVCLSVCGGRGGEGGGGSAACMYKCDWMCMGACCVAVWEGGKG